MTDPMANPGRRLYEQARRLQRTKRQYLLRRGVTAIPVEDAQVLKFQPRPVPPDKEEVTDGRQGPPHVRPNP